MSSSSTPARKPFSSAAASSQRQQRHRYVDEDDFTPEMRDRQARGKDPYKDDGSDFDDEDEDDDEVGSDGVARRRMRLGQGLKTEPFEDRERRGFALSVLDSPEQLMMYAQSSNDSIPSQRRRFSAMLAGFEPLPSSTTSSGEGSGGGSSSSRKPAGARRSKPKRPPGRPETGGEWVG